jgi:hypothetical protein
MRRIFFFLSLLTTGALAFSACVSADDSFGSGLIPDDQRPRVRFYSAVDIPFYTATVDSTITMTSSYTNVFGSIHVPPFGTVDAQAVFRIYPALADHSFGEHPVLRSAQLTLVVSGRKVADADQQQIVQNIYLYPLNKTLSYDSTYYNNSITANDYDPTPVSLPGLTYHGGDTLLIPLTPAFGYSLMSATASDMDSLAHFFERYKGFVLGVDAQPAGVAGGRLNQLDISKASLSINYTNDEGRDSSFYYYGDYGLTFSSIQHSSAALATPPATPQATVYFESLAGVKPVVDLAAVRDSILSLLQNHKDDDQSPRPLRRDQILINSAELVFSVESEPERYMDDFPTTLTLCSRTDTSGKVAYSMISEAYVSSIFGGSLNRSQGCYSFNLSQYVQQLVRQETTTEPTLFYLFPTTTLVDQTYGTSYTVIDNIGYSYGKLCGTGTLTPVKLNLVYTVLY